MASRPAPKPKDKNKKPLPAMADYSDEVTDQHLERIKALVGQSDFDDAEEIREAAW